MKKSTSLGRDERLQQNLKMLDLQKIAEIFPEYTRQASQAQIGYLEYLDHLVAQEAAWRHERMVKYRIGAAKLPFQKSLSGYDFSWPSRINKEKVLDLFDLSFIERKANAVLIGQTGLGKTHLCVALAFAACEANLSVRFTTAVGMVNHLTAAMADHTLGPKLKQYTRPKLLVIDELGYLPIDRKGADLIFQVVSARYEQGSIALTTNRPFKGWGEVMNDNTIASAMIDRLGHHADVVVIEGKSYRMKGKEPDVTATKENHRRADRIAPPGRSPQAPPLRNRVCSRELRYKLHPRRSSSELLRTWARPADVPHSTPPGTGPILTAEIGPLSRRRRQFLGQAEIVMARNVLRHFPDDRVDKALLDALGKAVRSGNSGGQYYAFVLQERIPLEGGDDLLTELIRVPYGGGTKESFRLSVLNKYLKLAEQRRR